MTARWIFAALLLAVAAAPCRAEAGLTVDTAPALTAWTGPEFAALSAATGINVTVTQSARDADILIAPAPVPQIAEHEKRTLPYAPRDTAEIPATLKDDDGDWTAIALTDLAFTKSATPPDSAAAAALRLLQLHGAAAPPDKNPAPLMTLAAGEEGAISFAASPSGARETIVIPYFIARLKGGHDPQNAAKLIDFLLSRPAQEALPALAWALPARTGITPAGGHFAALEKCLQGVTVYVPNWHRARKSLEG